MKTNPATRLALYLLTGCFFLLAAAPGAGAQPAFQWVNGGGGNNGVINGEGLQDAKLISADNRGHLYSFNVLNKGGVRVDTFQRNGTYNNQGDLLLCSWTCNGRLRWAKTIGDIYQERAFAMTSDNSGNVYVSGEGGRINGSVSTTFKINDSLISIAGTTTGSNIFIAKFDSSGQLKWLRFPGTANSINVRTLNEVRRMHIDASGRLAIHAQMANHPNNQFEGLPISGDSLFHLYRYLVDPATGAVSNLVRMQGVTGGRDVYSRIKVETLESDPAGNTYAILSGDTVSVLGVTAYASSTRNDYLMASFDNSGNPRWARKVEFSFNGVGAFPPQLALVCMRYFNNNLYLGGTMYRNVSYYGNILINPNQDTTQYCGIIVNLTAASGNFNGYNTIKAGQGPIRGVGMTVTAIAVRPATNELAYTGQGGGLTILNGTDTLKPTVSTVSGMVPMPVIIHNLNTQVMAGANLGANGFTVGSSITTDSLGNLFIGGHYQGGGVFTPGGSTLPYYGGLYNFFVTRYGQPGGCVTCTVPRASITSFGRSGQTVTVRASLTGSAADSLVWVWGDGATTRNTTPGAAVTHTYSGRQAYSLCLLAYSASCGNGDTCMPVSTVSVAGVAGQSGIRVYPNPVQDRVTVEGGEGAMLRITDLSGRVLVETKIGRDGKTNTGWLAPGVYVFEVSRESRIISKGRLIKD